MRGGEGREEVEEPFEGRLESAPAQGAVEPRTLALAEATSDSATVPNPLTG